MTGSFITLEGGEGAGKSTQARLLAASLKADGRRLLSTREPGGAPGAERLRALLLAGDHGLALRAEILVHFAARFDHVERTIAPALADGMLVLCDRFFDSTLAYQGYGLAHGDPDTLAFIESLTALMPVVPQLTLLLDVPRSVAIRRLDGRGGDPDRYERLDEAFHRRVADGFRAIAARSPERFVTVEAGDAIETVQARLLDEVRQRLPV